MWYERSETAPEKPDNYVYIVYEIGEQPPGAAPMFLVHIWSVEETTPGFFIRCSGPAFVARSIEEARALIPKGFGKAELLADPEAIIKEVYI